MVGRHGTRVLAVAAALACALAVVAWRAAPSPGGRAPVVESPAEAEGPLLGVAPGGLNLGTARQFEELVGRRVQVVSEFTGTKSWDEARTFVRNQMFGEPGGRPGWGTFAEPEQVQYVLAMGLVAGPERARTPEGEEAAVRYQREVAAGAHDADFRAIAQTLVEGGHPDAIIRLGWEHSGDWFLSRGDLAPEVWVAAWRRAVEAMRSVPGTQLRFEWALANGSATGKDPSTWYPGDEWVDVIGMSVYDNWQGPAARQVDHADPRQRSWADPERVWLEQLERPYGLAWMAEFARERGKPIGIGEWALSGGGTQAPDQAGNDNPYFIEAMHDWITSHDVLYHAYFQYDAEHDGPHRLEAFPRSAAVFRRLFGP